MAKTIILIIVIRANKLVLNCLSIFQTAIQIVSSNDNKNNDITARTNPQFATGPQKCVVVGPVGLFKKLLNMPTVVVVALEDILPPFLQLHHARNNYYYYFFL